MARGIIARVKFLRKVSCRDTEGQGGGATFDGSRGEERLADGGIGEGKQMFPILCSLCQRGYKAEIQS